MPSNRSEMTARPRVLPTGFLGMLALMAAIECGVIGLRETLGWSTWSFAYSFEWAGGAARDCEILCFGDSLVKCGIVPSVIEARTGRRTFNLAVLGSSAPFSYLLLRRSLDSGARPSAVIVDFSEKHLASPIFTYEQGMAEVFGLRDSVGLALQMKRADLLARWAFAQLCWTFRGRAEIREFILAGLAGQRPPVVARDRALRRNATVNQGALVLSKQVLRPANMEPGLLETNLTARSINLIYMRRFLDLAAERGIPVYVVLMPLDPPVQRCRFELGLEKRYDRTIQAMTSRYPNVTVLDGREMAMDSSAFADYTHVDRDGAMAVSQALADVLLCRARVGSLPRLVRLTVPTDAPATGPLEDSTQSVLALGAADPLRR